MKISQISNVTNYTNMLNTSTEKSNTSFKGLWGTEEHGSYNDREYSHNFIRYDYYPFKDETKQEIEKIVDMNSYYNSYAADVYDAVTQVESANVIVMQALPFTKKDFQGYLDKTISDLKKMVIENHIIEKNLRLVK